MKTTKSEPSKFKRVFWLVLSGAVVMTVGYAFIPLNVFDPLPDLLAVLIMGLGGVVFLGTLPWWLIATIVSCNRSNPPRPAEVVTIIALVCVLGFLCMPAFSRVREKGRQIQALQNARNFSCVLRLYAEDHDGNFPVYTLQDGKPTTTPVRDSNAAFEQLFDGYLALRSIFWVPESPFCSPAPPDEIPYHALTGDKTYPLKAGENEWAYVTGLNSKSPSDFPLITDGFSNPVAHTYSKDPNQKGGVWKGKVAIVIRVDSSGSVMPVDQETMTVTGSNGAGTTGDIFTTANGDKGWLKAENAVVNPR